MDPDESWQKFTRLDGLPSHEVLSLQIQDGVVSARLPTAISTRRDGRWVSERVPVSKPAAQALETIWRTHRVIFAKEGLRISGRRTVQPYPTTTGSHISAVLPRSKDLWVAWYGDGIWCYSNKRWTRPEVDLPPQARQVTAMAEGGGSIWVGTRREGLWQFDGEKWTNHIFPNEPYQHNIQALWQYGGKVWGSTLEDGLVAIDDNQWASVRSPTISSNAPRQAVEFKGAAYVRHGGGAVDVLRGSSWTRDAVRAAIPRKEAAAIASDASALYIGQFGGWSQFDGASWSHFFAVPGLQSTFITCLQPLTSSLAIGTQGKGLAIYGEGKIEWFDERQGFTDDWITATDFDGQNLYAGTFVGGLLIRESGKPWRASQTLAGQNVTAVSTWQDMTFIATRTGLWRFDGKALRNLNKKLSWLDDEVQSLLPTRAGLWVGTRTGLFFISHRTLQ
jgi:hypothetical protein